MSKNPIQRIDCPNSPIQGPICKANGIQVIVTSDYLTHNGKLYWCVSHNISIPFLPFGLNNFLQCSGISSIAVKVSAPSQWRRIWNNMCTMSEQIGCLSGEHKTMEMFYFFCYQEYKIAIQMKSGNFSSEYSYISIAYTSEKTVMKTYVGQLIKNCNHLWIVFVLNHAQNTWGSQYSWHRHTSDWSIH